MTTQPTYDDVNLLLRLYEIRREPRLRSARHWFRTQFQASTLEQFDRQCPQGSEESDFFRMVLNYWEMVASFITGRVLNAELFYQTGFELLLVWERIKAVLPALRERARNPLLYRNLEAVAASYIEWWKRHAPDAYEAFAQRVASLPGALGRG